MNHGYASRVLRTGIRRVGENMAEVLKFTCRECGQEHEGLPDIGFKVPWYYETLPDKHRVDLYLDSDFCRIEDDFFIRGSLEIPITGMQRNFSYGVWMSVSEKNYRLYQACFDSDAPTSERYVGYISNRIDGYPDTLKLIGAAHVRGNGLRPFIVLQSTDHPLSIEQRQGISFERAVEIAIPYMHEKSFPSRRA
jgi:hypothetical protein